MIKEIIFDCFGVLTQDGWSKLCQKYATDETIDELRSLNRRVDSGLLGFDPFIDSVSQLTGASRKDILDILVNSYHPEDEVFKFIAELKVKYKIGLISNISAPIEEYLPTAPIDLFDEQTLSYQVGVAKPDTRIFEIHLNKSGLLPEEAAFIDDREVNVEAAKRAGLHGIWYKNLDQLKEDLRQLGIDC